MPITIVQPKHMAAFACLGAECPDTCCKDWAIDVDPATERRWRRHPDPIWRNRLKRGMRRVNDAQAKPRTLLAMRPDGSCPFHDADRLCS